MAAWDERAFLELFGFVVLALLFALLFVASLFHSLLSPLWTLVHGKSVSLFPFPSIRFTNRVQADH